jgi:hypothetical protein
MKLAVTEEFHDKVEDIIRHAGDVLTVSEARGAELLAARVCTQLPDEKPAGGPKKPAKRAVKK